MQFRCARAVPNSRDRDPRRVGDHDRPSPDLTERNVAGSGDGRANYP